MNFARKSDRFHFFLLLVILGFVSCTKDKINPLRYNLTEFANIGTELSILAIGNSFSENAIDSLPSLVSNIESISNVALYKATINSSSLEEHYNNLLVSENLYSFAESSNKNNYKWSKSSMISLTEVLQQYNYDIIVLQQVSGLSGKWESIQPYIMEVINLIKANTSYEPTFVWHMTWSYDADAIHPCFELYNYSEEQMYREILQVSQDIISNTPIDFVIPSAIMVNILRNLNPTIDYTCDGYHILQGLGNIALSSLWYQTLIYPFTKNSVVNCFKNSDYNLSQDQINDIIYAVNNSIKWEE